MLTPSLWSISGRRRATVDHHQKTGPHTLLSQISDNSADALTQKTESIHSDDALPSSSGVIVSSIPKFRLEDSFPSILSTVDIMQSLKTSKNIDGIRSISQVFSTCVRTIIRSMDVLPSQVRLDPAYEVARYGVIFTGNLFTGQVSKISSSSVPDGAEMSSMALEMAEMTISSLRSFLKIAERLVKERKPLPAVPTEFVVDEPAAHMTAPLVNIVNEILDTEGIAGATTSHDCDTSGTTNVSLEKKKKRLRRNSIIRRIVKRGSIASKASLFSYRTRSSVTLVNREVNNSLTTDEKPRPPEPTFVLRQSAMYYLADPYCPEIDVAMPVPTGDTAAVRLDQHGSMKAASITALVRMLTSKDSVLDPEFTTTFFISFRFFMTPTRFYEELAKRFDEQPLADLNPAQLRIWTRYAMGVHIRVGKAILMWLDLYWRPDMDHEVLEALQAFTVERLVCELPEGLAGHILQGLDSVGGDEPICRRTRKAKDLEFVYDRSMVVAPPPCPTFEIIIDADLDVTAQLLKFNTPAGREEVARQITVELSDQFQQVDPEDAVMYWHRNQDSEAGRTLQQIVISERALCLWTTYTVLQQSSVRERCRLLEFWLDVATRCLRLRNFSGANCIYGGVSNSAIGRMKKTILDVSIPSKHQYGALQTFLEGRDNYSDYRQALTLVEPTVPMIAPLIRDVTSAMDVVPTAIGCTDECEEKNLINFNSYRITSKTVRAMESCLIPYKFSKDDAFQAWIRVRLAEFPPERELEIHNSFYNQSLVLEAKEPLLIQLKEPWSYIMTGSLDGVYTLHSLSAAPSSGLRCIPNFLKR